MKTLALLGLLLAPLFAGGCFAPPAYSGKENAQRIVRNWDYDAKQIVDDWDHFWMNRPASDMTIWNVRSAF
jgi:hypothetical protein